MTSKFDRNYGGKKRRVFSGRDRRTCNSTRTEIEEALAAQRTKYSNESTNNNPNTPLSSTVSDAAAITVAPHIPGMIYDPETDRYYKVSDRGNKDPVSQKGTKTTLPSQAMKTSSTGDSADDSNNPSVNRMSIVRALMDRSLGSQSRARAGVRNELWKCYRGNYCASHLRLFLSCTSVSSITSPAQVAFHPAYGAMVTNGHNIKMFKYHTGTQTLGTVNMRNRLRNLQINNLTSPKWRPFCSNLGPSEVNGADDLKLAVIGEGDNSMSQVVYLRLQLEDLVDEELSVGINTRLTGAASVPGRKSKELRDIAWGAKGDLLFSMCDHGVYADIPGESDRRGRMIIDGHQKCKNHSDRRGLSTGSPAVSICSSITRDKSLFVGLRNGTIIIADLRAPTVTLRSGTSEYNAAGKVGNLPFCVDHILAMKDGFSLVAQDVTGTLSVYDTRKPAQPYLSLVEPSNDVRRRGFWVTADESVVVAPANCDLSQRIENGSSDSYACIDERDGRRLKPDELSEVAPVGALIAFWDLKCSWNSSGGGDDGRLLAVKVAPANPANNADVVNQFSNRAEAAVRAAGGSAMLGPEARKRKHQPLPWDTFTASIAPNVDHVSYDSSMGGFYCDPSYVVSGYDESAEVREYARTYTNRSHGASMGSSGGSIGGVSSSGIFHMPENINFFGLAGVVSQRTGISSIFTS